ncbi:MAG: anaerobic ribonucleoside-triphosphate reductase activating protein [Clostridium sp.]
MGKPYKMNYHRLDKADMTNGEGVRVTLYVGGCDHACKGCYNKSTWNPDNGDNFTEGHVDEIIDSLRPDYISGLSLTGGDPLYHGNLSGILRLIAKVRMIFGNTKNIWMWTGYTFDEIMNQGGDGGRLRRSILKEVDVLIDGKFEKDKYDPGLAFRGSSNQVIHKFTEF